MTRVSDGTGLIQIDVATERADGGPPIPCHRCGVCCERWQPLLTRTDAARLASYLDLSPDTFRSTYTVPYPFDDERRLLAQIDGRCVFLRYAAVTEHAPARAGCAVHPARPDACRDWQAGLGRRECVQGLARFVTAGASVALDVLYPDRAEAEAFRAAAVAAGTGVADSDRQLRPLPARCSTSGEHLLL